ncbi:MAG: hypothetical protein V3S80_09935 [Sulfurimonadaceae bacterium]
MTITNADIVSRLKLLADEHLKADSGSITTAVNSSISDGNDYTNSLICFISGDNIGVDRVITSYAIATGTFTFDALTAAVTNIDEFCVVSKGFLSDVAQATSIVTNDLRNRGYDVDLFLNFQTQLKELYIYKTIELVCASLMNDGQDQDSYFVNYERFKKLYEVESSKLIADYDANEDCNIYVGEENLHIGQVGFLR